MIDEARDVDGDMISEVVLPQLNVSRRMYNGEVNPRETLNHQIIFSTSAGTKSSYAYEKLIDTFEKAIIDPNDAFCIGLDYRIPVLHGLIDPKYVRDLKMSPSYNDTTFAAEFMGTWLGGSDESWFDFEKLARYRKLKNPEWRRSKNLSSDSFYLMSIDVGRLHDATVATIFKVQPSDQKYYSTVVNIVVLGKSAEARVFERQVIDMKKLIELYRPREVVIDTNGLGISIADLMIKEQYDEKGNLMPAYGFFNSDDYKKIQPKDAPMILFSMKANGPLNSKIHSNVYSRLTGGLVRFLITEQDARSTLLSTKKGQKMSFEDRVKRLMPHEMTTKLFDEMANLRVKRAGLDIVLEQINARFPKDKYSSLAYGLWRIRELEEEAYKKHKRKSGLGRQLIFFTGGK